MKDLFEQLNSIKNLEPDKKFAGNLRQTLLSLPKSSSNFYYSQTKQRFQESLSFALAVGLTAILIYTAVSALNNKEQPLIAEKEPAPEFDIHLSKAQYYKEIAPNVYIVVLEDK